MKKKEIAKAIAIAGAGGSKSSSSSSTRTPVEAADTLRSRTMVSILDLLGEGQIGGLISGAQSIFIDDVALENPDGSVNYKGVTWAFRDGTQHQSVIEGFSDVHTPYSVAVKVGEFTPRTVSIDNDNADMVQVVVRFPKLVSVDTKSGDSNGTQVKMRFSIANGSGDFIPVLPYNESLPADNGKVALSTDGQSISLRGKKSGVYYRAFTFELPKPGGNYRLRMERLTADSTSDYLANETWFDSYSEIKKTSLNYPNSALVGLTFDAEYFTSGSVPSRSYLVSGMRIRVPANYDTQNNTYNGDWDGSWQLASSCNPAWILLDILTNKRYGLGQYISESAINLGMLYQIARYCDQEVSDGFGGKERRFAINTVISRRAEAYSVLNDIASAFRAMLFWAGGMIGLSQDRPAEPVMLISQANIIGEFEYKGSARKDRPTVALVTYNDKTDNYKQNIEYVEDAAGIERYGIRETEVVAFGCTSRGQAYRLGLWLLYTARMESDLITFTTGPDMALVLPGDLLKIQDRYRAGRRASGRIAGKTANSIRLDAPTDVPAGSFVTIMSATGELIDRDVLESGTVEVVTFTQPLSAQEMPADLGLWVITSPDLTPVLGRVVSVSQGKEVGTFDVSCVQHNPSKFAAVDDGAALLPVSNTILDPTYSTPSNLTVNEGTYWESPGNLGIRLILSWEGRSPVYIVLWRRSDTATDWQSVEVRDEQYDILGIAENGVYDIRVVAVSVSGKHSEPVDAVYHVKGTMTPPGAPTALTAVGDYRCVILNWANPDSVDLDHIQVLGSRTNDLDTATLLAKVASTTWTHSGLGDNETWFYWVRAANKRQMTGPVNSNLGTQATTVDVLSFLQDQITRSELGKDLLEEIDAKATIEKVEESLDSINARIDALNADIEKALEEATAKIDQARSDIDQTIDDLNQLLDDVGETKSRVDQTKSELDQVAADLNQVVADLSQVNIDLEQITSDLDKVTADLNQTIANVDQMTTDLDQVKADLNQAQSELEANIQSLSDRIDEEMADASAKIIHLEELSEEAATAIDAVAARADDLAAAIATEREARIEEDEALAKLISLIQAEVGDNVASIKEMMQAFADMESAQVDIVTSLEAAAWANIENALDDFQSEERQTRINASIKTSQKILANQQEALAQTILEMEARFGEDIEASLIEERLVRAREDEALARSIDALSVSLRDELTASITEERKARVDEDEALASSITALKAQVGEDIAAAVLTETTARATETEALAGRIDALTAQSGDASAAIIAEATARATEDEALAGRIDVVTSQIEYVSAAVLTETTTRATEDEALGKRIEAILVKMGEDIAAAVLTETNARVTEDEALASSISALTAQVSKDIAAAVLTESQARATEDEALAESVSTLTTQMGKDIAAAVLAESKARASEDEALAGSVSALTTQMGKDIAAAVLAESKARSTEDEALAASVSALSAQMNDDIAAAITEERKVRVNAEEALARSIEGLTAQVNDDILSAITEERKARVKEDEALATSLSALEVQVGKDITAAVLTETTARATAEEAISKRIDALTAGTGDMSAAVIAEATARATEDEAIGKRIDALIVQVGKDIAAAVLTETTARATEDESLASRIDSLIAQTSDDIKAAVKTETDARTSADGALSSRIDTLIAQMGDEIAAAVLSQTSALVSEDEALGNRIDALKVQVGKDITAAVLTETTARATSEGALSKRIDDLSAVSGDASAAVSAEAEARATADGALAGRIDALQVKFGKDITAAVFAESQARVYEDEAIILDVKALKVQMGKDIAAAVLTESQTRATEDEALGQRIDSLIARMGEDIAAAVRTETTARVTEDKALGSRIDTIVATYEDNTAVIQETREAVAAIDGKVSASWTLKVETASNGIKYAAGLALGVDESGTSQFLVSADRFGLVNNAGGKVTIPFVVDNGTAYMNAAYIKNASIDNAKIADGAITNAKISGLICSDNYSWDDKTGWAINKNGGSVFNNVVVRGEVHAYSGTFNNVTINDSCTVYGTVYAEKISGDVVKCYTIADTETVSITPMPFARSLVLPYVGVNIAPYNGASTYTAGVTVRVVIDGRATSVTDTVSSATNARSSGGVSAVWNLPANATATVQYTYSRGTQSTSHAPASICVIVTKD
ncbi:phage tail protein [Klebsiella pneumoniae]|nr:phage tail protein [Klebsiella pneumoniae]